MKKRWKGIAALAICASMILSYVPSTAFAAEESVASEESIAAEVSSDEGGQAAVDSDDLQNAVGQENETEDEASGEAGSVQQKDGNVEKDQPAESAQAKAQTDQSAENEQAELAGEQQELTLAAKTKTARIKGLPDSDDLFAAYVNQEFGIEEEAAKETEVEGHHAEAASNMLTLDGQNLMVYNILKEGITEIANGQRTSTEFEIPVEDLGISKTSYTADELGVDLVYDGHNFTDEALAAMYDMIQVDFPTVMEVLAAQMPYELYWYDKTVGYEYGNKPGLSGRGYGLNWSIFFTTGVSINLHVASAYAGAGDFQTDAEKTGAAALAAERAKDVVAGIQNARLGDYEKLTAYKEYICDAVTYNSEAASSSWTGGYGDPWQLIYVFDGDPDTNVVCEGYSKAFQYLCDQSSWRDESFRCKSVNGLMSGGTGQGRHMWNVVTLHGKNYLADITNSDQGTSGARGQLFLAGTTDGDDTHYTISWGSYQEGNLIYPAGSIKYTYDSKILSFYDASERILAEDHYDPAAYPDEPEEIDNQFSAWAETSDDQTVPVGTAVTLEVGASAERGEIRYAWYEYDPETGEEKRLDGENENRITVTADAYRVLFCTAFDEFGNQENVWFYIGIENDLFAYASEEDYYSVSPGTPLELEVTAGASNGNLRYQWYKYDESSTNDQMLRVDGAVEAKLAIVSEDAPIQYICRVRDDYENYVNVWFTVAVDNAFSVWADSETDFFIKPGTKVALKVGVSAADDSKLRFEWSSSIEDMDDISGKTYTAAPTSSGYYCCYVSDGYGNDDEVYFYVNIDNSFQARAKDGITTVYASQGDDLALETEASCKMGQLTYKWYVRDAGEDEYKLLDDETSGRLLLSNVQENTEYWVEITDDYGNQTDITYWVKLASKLVLSRGQIDAGPGQPAEYVVRAYSPDKTTPISFQWLDEDGNELEGTVSEDGLTSSLKVVPAKSDELFVCRVSQGQESKRAYLYTYIETNLQIDWYQSWYDVKIGDRVTLSVSARSDVPPLTYQWYSLEGNAEKLIEGADQPDYPLTLQSPMERYECRVSDGYNETSSSIMTVVDKSALEGARQKADAGTMILDEPVYLQLNSGDETWYRFTPEYDAGYRFDQGGGYYRIDVFDENNTLLAYDEDQFTAEAGKTYLVRVSYTDEESQAAGMIIPRIYHFENGFYAYHKDHISTKYVMSGESTTLEVDAGCILGDIFYDWYTEGPEGVKKLPEHTARLVVDQITEYEYYWVYVYDSYGNGMYLGDATCLEYTIEVVDELKLQHPENIKIPVDFKGGTLIHVEAVTPDQSTPITYQWYGFDENTDEYVEIDGATQASYTLPDRPMRIYMCRAKQGDEIAEAYTYIRVFTDLHVEADEKIIHAKDGESVLLATEAHSELPMTYRWFHGKSLEDAVEMEDVKTAMAAVKLQGVAYDTWFCKVSDAYNTAEAHFYVINDDLVVSTTEKETAADLKVGTPCPVFVPADQMVWLAFTPDQSGSYTIYSNANSDTYGYLLNADGEEIANDDDSGEWSNFKITELLEAGKTYYIQVRPYDRSDQAVFDVVVTKTGDENRISGDINNDGQVNGLDLIRLKQYMAGFDVAIDASNADVNADGNVNGMDVILLCRYFAGYDVALK